MYSLCSKVLFEALGEPDNRNRRQHDAQTIKERLMGFDYVLGLPGASWFPTEKDKVTLFAGDLGIQKEHLPVWRYSSKDGKQTTFRWFVDKLLVFKSGLTRRSASGSSIQASGRQRRSRRTFEITGRFSRGWTG